MVFNCIEGEDEEEYRVERKTKKDSIIGMREAISGMWDLD